jgi:hypothetical protein
MTSFCRRLSSGPDFEGGKDWPLVSLAKVTEMEGKRRKPVANTLAGASKTKYEVRVKLIYHERGPTRPINA